jgi:glycosyltransferase involved in cell wall biosynthesis
LSNSTPLQPQAPAEVCHLVDSLEVGGMEQMLCELALEQKRNGWNVIVGCLFRRGPLEAKLLKAGIEVVCFAKKPGLDLKAVRAIRVWLKSHPEAIIHTHNAVVHYYAAFALLGITRTIAVNTRHDMGLHTKSARLSHLYKLAVRKTVRIAAVCEAAKTRFVASGEIPENKCVVIPNGIDVAKFGSTFANAQNIRTIANLPSDKFIIGTVGRLNEVKAQHVLIEAVDELIRRGFPVQLILVGNGPEKAKLSKLVEERKLQESVFFMGERSDVSQFLWSFDIFALPSKTEGYSMALVEASSAGLTIVASDVGGNREIISPDHNGLLYPAQEQIALIDILQNLIENPERRKLLGLNAQKWAVANGGLQSMYSRYIDAYGLNS